MTEITITTCSNCKDEAQERITVLKTQLTAAERKYTEYHDNIAAMAEKCITLEKENARLQKAIRRGFNKRDKNIDKLINANKAKTAVNVKLTREYEELKRRLME